VKAVSRKLDPSLALELININKSFNGQMVCKDINLPLKKSKVLAILGPSGCGKTVTIKMIIGLIIPDNGSILFDDIDIAEIKNDDEFLPIRRRISMVFQGSALFDSMDVFDNISYPLRVQGVKNATEIKDRVMITLSLVGLPDVASKMPGELSGGMKKRVGLARAIVTEPEIILYDEPTAGLDPINTRRIIDLILMLEDNFKCTSVVIAHDMDVIKAVSDRAAFFYGGRVRQLGTFTGLWESEDAIVRGFVRGDPSILLTTRESL
jgi:phospholipid/cholesterol/gamma-HCH transport system ATP-binding protein